MTFYFFDVETSGFSPRDDRIMQFAGQRTDMNLKPIGEPDNLLVKMTPDVLPQPDAVLVHGITPQKTLADGITEAEFCKYLTAQVFTPDTIAVGFNNIRFDNEFIRFVLWRNFYDAYEWTWKDGASTWDLLDVVRMTRALRPEGIEWPFAPDGKPSNRLEYLSSVNKLDHSEAHDALSDVKASIELAKLVKAKQPQLFDYLLKIRNKREVAPIVMSGKPFIYTSGKYPSDWEKTTIAVMVAPIPDRDSALVYDLRIDPDEFANLPPSELAEKLKAYGKDAPYFPVKELKFNKCPAVVADLRVLYKDEQTINRLKIRPGIINNHYKKLNSAPGFEDKLVEAWDIANKKQQPELVTDPQKVDNQLYDNFVSDADKTKMSAIRAAKPDEIADLSIGFKDERLQLLLPLYIARNYPKVLNQEQQSEWDNFRRRKLLEGDSQKGAPGFFSRLEELAKTPGLDGEKKYLLEELNLYAQSVLPFED